MAKFSGHAATTRSPRAATHTTGPAATHETGSGHEKDAKTALYTLAVSSMAVENSFYEPTSQRHQRFCDLVHQVTGDDPEWMTEFIPWLRQTANMRTAPLIAALEYARARGPHARDVVASAMDRADEPAEALGYWWQSYGRRLPMAVKRGIGDAANRLYTENAAIKHDGVRSGVRMGDVIDIVHPNPHDLRSTLDEDVTEEVERRLLLLKDYTPEHALSVRDNVTRDLRLAASARAALRCNLYGHLIDRRHGTNHTGTAAELGLTRLAATYELDETPAEQRRAVLAERGVDALAAAGYTWERLSGWLPGGMDAEAWEAVIPSMGYMALLRNLRNFEQAGVDETVLAKVAGIIADPDQVARSRQFPYRFLSAYTNSGTTFFAPALEKALDLSVRNIPPFPGRTLVMVDTSGSMGMSLSAHSQVANCDIAALFGVAVAAVGNVDLAIYANTSARIPRLPTSVLRGTELIQGKIGAVGHGTETWPSTLREYDGHDRIVVFTDSQDHPSLAHQHLPDVPIYVWDLSGYKATNVDLDRSNRHLFAGFTDTAFRLIALLEAGHDTGWPWEH